MSIILYLNVGTAGISERDNSSEEDPIVYNDEYGGLTQNEVEWLAHVSLNSPEIRERKDLPKHSKLSRWLIYHGVDSPKTLLCYLSITAMISVAINITPIVNKAIPIAIILIP